VSRPEHKSIGDFVATNTSAEFSLNIKNGDYTATQFAHISPVRPQIPADLHFFQNRKLLAMKGVMMKLNHCSSLGSPQVCFPSQQREAEKGTIHLSGNSLRLISHFALCSQDDRTLVTQERRRSGVSLRYTLHFTLAYWQLVETFMFRAAGIQLL